MPTTWHAGRTASADGTEAVPRNERCPCGSEEKYKRCCFTKGFHCYIDEATDEVLLAVPVNSELRSGLEPALAKQREKFIAKFGREPGPDDPIFFDLDEGVLREHRPGDAISRDPTRVDLRAREDGFDRHEPNRHLISAADLDEWEDAVAEYYELHPDEDPVDSPGMTP